MFNKLINNKNIFISFVCIILVIYVIIFIAYFIYINILTHLVNHLYKKKAKALTNNDYNKVQKIDKMIKKYIK